MPSQPRKRRGLSTWLVSAATPLFVVDRRRRVVFFNSGCERITGWTAGEVIGCVCNFASEPDHKQVEALTGALCPPPQVFEGLEQSVPTVVLTKSGARLSRLIRFFPLVGENRHVERVLGIVSDVPQLSSSAAEPLDHERHAELAALRSDLYRRYSISTLVGCSSHGERLLQQVDLARRHAGSVHFQGEPGTGKEHLARLIHSLSETRQRAFVPLDLTLLNRSEMSETVNRVLRDARDPDAASRSPGTLYLKDVDRLPDTLQKLLLDRFGSRSRTRLRDGEHVAFGGEHAADEAGRVRLMSSSCRTLDEAVAEDRLSEEFVHLLTTQQIVVPPLRDRSDDVLFLAQYFLESLNRTAEVQVAEFAAEVRDAFHKYFWPGNVDELQAVVAEAHKTCGRHTIGLPDLPFRFRAGRDAQSVTPPLPIEIGSLEETLADVERECIQRALQQAQGNKSLAAELLGITRPRLYRRMQFLGLAGPDADSSK
ncbi:MAG: helix-turn-helix domain-containing protein [Planctomycetaceae bacterium]